MLSCIACNSSVNTICPCIIMTFHIFNFQLYNYIVDCQWYYTRYIFHIQTETENIANYNYYIGIIWMVQKTLSTDHLQPMGLTKIRSVCDCLCLVIITVVIHNDEWFLLIVWTQFHSAVIMRDSRVYTYKPCHNNYRNMVIIFMSQHYNVFYLYKHFFREWGMIFQHCITATNIRPCTSPVKYSPCYRQEHKYAFASVFNAG